ncbi:MAG: hypothetical protein IJK67_05230 [Bacilli bacterium]|nr:hypothetical protein [Bacilli bacterium]
MEEEKKVDFLKTFYLLLIIIPTQYITLNLFQIFEDTPMMIAIFLPMLLGYLLYGIGFSKLEKKQKILYILSFILFLIAFCSFKKAMSIDGGLDSVGEALGLVIIYRFSIIICRILALILLVISERKNIFKKKFLIPFSIIVVIIAIIVCLIKWIPTLNYREEKNIKTLADFKNELDRRNIFSNSSLYKVYGINKNGEKELSFEYNSADQYPEFIFVKYGNNNENEWIIYYVNGQISAVYGQFYIGYNGEEKIIWEYPYLVLSEGDEVVTYNDEKDIIEKGKSLYFSPCDKCKTYIYNTKLCYGSQYCDLLAITLNNVGYIDKNSLEKERHNYLKKYSYKN